MRFLSILSAIALMTFASVPRAAAVNTTVPGEIETEATFECLGIKWWIEGDENLDCDVDVGYRELSESGDWRAAQPLLRVEPGSFNDFQIDPGNLLAGSIFHLTPDTEYEIRLTLYDPDGGAAAETRIVCTRALPAPAPDARVRYVVPGEGGGSGTQADPFQGLMAADGAAEPGDLFILQAGTYSNPIVFTASGEPDRPIVWFGEDRDTVILDGEHTAPEVVRFAGTEHVHLESLTITRPREWCIVGSETKGVVIRGCRLDVSVPSGWEQFGIDCRGPGHEQLLISGNTIEGYLNWEDGRDEDAYGCIVSGTGHVIRFNEIFNWWDGIQVGADEQSTETSGCDVYRNEVYNCTDDGIETDASRHNIRVYENRITNCLTGLSAQPVFGGPAYLIRNVVYNWQLKPLKFHQSPTGMIVFHNTLIGADPRGWGGGDWRHTIARNNIIVGGSTNGYTGDPICLETVGLRADLDYNGWYQAISDRFADFNYEFYTSLGSFQAGTGMELNGLLLDLGVFVDAEEPPLGSFLGQDGYFPPYDPESQDLRLVEGAIPIDAGEFLANINDDRVGAAPDLGAYEFGTSIPVYGPEAELPTLLPEENPAGPPVARIDPTPNPSHGSTLIAYDLPKPQHVHLRIFDPAGRVVATLKDGSTERAGRHLVVWDARDDAGNAVRSGPYFFRLEADDLRGSGRIIIVH